jgi:hypothetical protein
MLMNRGVETRNPESAEDALLLTAVYIRMLSGLHHGFVGLAERGLPHTAVAFRKLTNLLMSAMPNCTSINTHDLKVRKEGFELLMFSLLHNQRTIQLLLPLALLLQQMVTATAFDDNLAASGLTDSLLCAAVGLLLRHISDEL